jgi:hypothetical protein
VDDVTVAAAGSPVQARLDVDVVRRQYYSSLEGSDSWNIWIRGQYYDPDELIVEDESSGDLYRVPYTVAGQEVTFGERVAVLEEFVDKPKEQEKATAVLAAMSVLNQYRKPVAVYASRDESRKDIEVAGTTATVPDPKALRALVGLGDDATDDALVEALSAAGIIYTPGGGSGKAPGAEAPGTTDSATQAAGASIPNLTGPSGSNPNDPAVASPTQSPVAAGVRTLDEATYQALMAGAQAGNAALARFNNTDRDTAIAAAIQQGRIPKSREGHWKDSWEKDPEGTKTLLTAAADKGGLAPGLIPVAEAGGIPAAGGELGDGQEDDAYPPEWLPEVQARKARDAAVAAAAQAGQVYHPNANVMRRGM